MKKLLQPVIKKWYWFLLGAAVLGEAAVFLFSEKTVTSPSMTIWTCSWGISWR